MKVVINDDFIGLELEGPGDVWLIGVVAFTIVVCLVDTVAKWIF